MCSAEEQCPTAYDTISPIPGIIPGLAERGQTGPVFLSLPSEQLEEVVSKVKPYKRSRFFRKEIRTIITTEDGHHVITPSKESAQERRDRRDGVLIDWSVDAIRVRAVHF